ncbi:MAG: hypothetical protein ACXVII_43050, partial [Solirubrobacteraceae bacterium]
AAFLFALEAPVLLVLAVGAALTRALLALSSATDRVARSVGALPARHDRSAHRRWSEPARAATRLGRQS